MLQAESANTTTSHGYGNVVRLRPRSPLPLPPRSPELAILTAILMQMPRKKRCQVAGALMRQFERSGCEEIAQARNYVAGLCFGGA